MEASLLSCILLVICCSGLVSGYITGAPLQSCSNIEPGHGYLGQTGASPYTIVTSSSNYTCRRDLTVTISGNTTFKGFHCQVRHDANVYQTYGSLVSTGSVPTTNNCGSNQAAITHSNSEDKQAVTFTWKPATTNVTSVNVVCTFVQKLDTYWVRQQSGAITFVEGGDCSPKDDDDDDSNSAHHFMASTFVLLIGYTMSQSGSAVAL